MRTSQKSLFKKQSNSSYGGSLLTTRKGRSKGRPLSCKSSMHLVLRSSKAQGKFSFLRSKNRQSLTGALKKFSKKYSVRLNKVAIMGNHIHIHLKLNNRHSYKPFIRAITSAIAMAVTGAGKGRPLSTLIDGHFWDRRPFSRIIMGLRDYNGIDRYLKINIWESMGFSREAARYLVMQEWPASR